MPSRIQERSPSRRALLKTSWVSRSRSSGSGRRKSGPRGPDQQQQVVDEAVHPVQLVLDHRDRLLALVGILAEGLEVAADHGDRGPQLVADVGQELALVGERGLEAVEHRVQRAAELRDLVVAAAPGSACERSVSEICRAVRASACRGAIARPAASQMNSEASSSTTIETPTAIRTALSTCSRRSSSSWPISQGAGLVAGGDRDGDVAGGAERRVDRRRPAGSSTGPDVLEAVDQLASGRARRLRTL